MSRASGQISRSTQESGPTTGWGTGATMSGVAALTAVSEPASRQRIQISRMLQPLLRIARHPEGLRYSASFPWSVPPLLWARSANRRLCGSATVTVWGQALRA